jgi:DNA-binding CsgD family transcriptional regulator
MIDKLTQNDYQDVLKIGNLCISSLKSGKLEIKEILNQICEIFESNNVEFFPPNDTLDGVDLAKACDLNGPQWALNQYADYYWRYDPLFSAQFCSEPTNLVFKTDDIISYHQLKNLDYYRKYLVLRNWLSELVIRLCDEVGFYGTFSISRSLTQPSFEDKDVCKAKLMLPYLMNLFQGVYRFSLIEEKLKVLEYWAGSQREGFLVIDSKCRLVFSNDKAQRLCQRLYETYTGMEYREYNLIANMPLQILEDCKQLFENFKTNDGSLTKHRIITTHPGEKCYLRYVLIRDGVREPFLACFITSMSELIHARRKSDETVSNRCELSLREQTIIRYIATGFTNKELGKLLSISPFTVQNHLRNIFQKTGIVNRTQLVSLVK